MDYDNLEEIKIKKRLDEIADLIKSGKNPNIYQKELDILLNTELSDRSAEAEAVYEDMRHPNE